MAEKNSQSDPFRYKVDLWKAFAEDPPPLDFVLPGMLQGTVGALIAPGSGGKSIFAMQLGCMIAHAIASGLDLLGLGELPRGRVLYLCAEDPRAILMRRFHAIAHRISQEGRRAIAQNLDAYALMGVHIDLATNAKHQARLMAQAHNRRLVILDTLRRIQSLDENSSGDMARLLTVLERVANDTGTSILYLHHTTKEAARAGALDTQQASRGSSVLVDNVRWQGYIIGMSADEAKLYGVDANERGWYARFGISKQNYGPPVPDRWYRRGEAGVLESVVLERRNRGKGGDVI